MQLRLLLAILTTSYLCHQSLMVDSRSVDIERRLSPLGLLEKAPHDVVARNMMTSGGKLMIPDRMSLSPTSHKHRHHHQLHRHLRTTTTLKAKTTIASTQPITSSTTAIPQVTTESVTEKPLHATLVASVPTHTHTIAAANSFTARSFYLYNRCTGAHVQVLGKRISALSSAQGKDENFAVMTLRQQTFGGNRIGVTIQAKRAGVYVCFNKYGKLVTRFSSSSVNCLFTETPADNNYIKFESVYNPDWSVGFNRKGRPIHEQIGERQRRQKCYQFVKRPVTLELQRSNINIETQQEHNGLLA